MYFPQLALLPFFSHSLGFTYIREIYDKAFNEFFHANTTLAITGTITESSTDKSYEELGLVRVLKIKTLAQNFFCVCVKFSKGNHQTNSNMQHQTTKSGNIPSFFVKHDCFKNSFFLLQ